MGLPGDRAGVVKFKVSRAAARTPTPVPQGVRASRRRLSRQSRGSRQPSFWACEQSLDDSLRQERSATLPSAQDHCSPGRKAKLHEQPRGVGALSGTFEQAGLSKPVGPRAGVKSRAHYLVTSLLDSAGQQLLHRPRGRGSRVPVAPSCGQRNVRQPEPCGLPRLKAISTSQECSIGGFCNRKEGHRLQQRD